MTKWLLLSVLAGLSPIFINAFTLRNNGKGLSSETLLGTGELYLISTAIFAAGVGELFFDLRPAGSGLAGPRIQIFISLATILSLLCALVCAGSYGSKPADSAPLDSYVDTSILFFICALFMSAICTFLAELK